MLRIAAAALATTFLIGRAVGDEASASALDDAKILARSGHIVEAAEKFGEAAALAQKALDPVAENEIADDFAEFVFRETNAASIPVDGDPGLRPTTLRMSLLAAATDRLDPARSGAFVSAPVLARYVLELSTETGDLDFVAAAAKVAALHVSTSRSGKGAATTAKYAEGMRCAAASRPKEATAPLLAAFTEASAAGWSDLAMHAGLELTVAWSTLGDEAKATKALRDVDSVLEDHSIRFLLHWVRCMETRFPDPQHPLRKILRGIQTNAERYGTKERGYAGPAGEDAAAPGGEGGKGTTQVDQTSGVGALFPDLVYTARLVTVTRRTYDGFEIRRQSRPGDCTRRKIDDRVENDVEGGVGLTFQGPSVAMRTLDLVGTAGTPESSRTPREADAARPFYLLAQGETWVVAKDGTVHFQSR